MLSPLQQAVEESLVNRVRSKMEEERKENAEEAQRMT